MSLPPDPSMRFQRMIDRCAENAASAHHDELPQPSSNEYRHVRVLDDILAGLDAPEACDLTSIETITLIDALMEHEGEDWLRVRDRLTKIIGTEAVRRSNAQQQ